MVASVKLLGELKICEHCNMKDSIVIVMWNNEFVFQSGIANLAAIFHVLEAMSIAISYEKYRTNS